jgi:hypothetical protein
MHFCLYVSSAGLQMDPADPIEDCITVFVRQDDLAATRTVDCAGEPCDAASFLPNEPPIEEDTGAAFEPFDVPDREPTAMTLPETPVELFQSFIPDFLVELWVKWTNASPIPGPEGLP